MICAPGHCLVDLCTVFRFLVVGDESYDGCVVRIFVHVDRIMVCFELVGVEGEKPGRKDTTLWGACAEGQRGGYVVANFNPLLHVFLCGRTMPAPCTWTERVAENTSTSRNSDICISFKTLPKR